MLLHLASALYKFYVASSSGVFGFGTAYGLNNEKGQFTGTPASNLFYVLASSVSEYNITIEHKSYVGYSHAISFELQSTST